MTITHSSVQQRLTQLMAEGATPVHAIKTIHLEFGLSLADAKREFSSSTAWQRQAASADGLHAEVMTALAKGYEA
jgi:hypothetical protein